MVNMIYNPNLSNYSVFLYKRSNGLSYTLLSNASNISIIREIIIEQDVDTLIVDVIIRLNKLSDTSFIELGDIVHISVPYIDLNGNIVHKRIGIFYVLEQNLKWDGELVLNLRNLGHWAMNQELFIKLDQGETSSLFIRRTAQLYGIPISHIDKTIYQHQSHLFDKSSLYNAWLNAISKTMIEEDKSFRMRFDDIGLRVEEIIDGPQFWWFEVGQKFNGVIEPNRTISIMDPDFVNIARGVYPPNQANNILGGLLSASGNTIEEKNTSSIAKYGAFYRDIDVSNFESDKEVRDHLSKLVKKGEPVDKIQFSIFALNSLLPLDRIYVKISQIEATGKYFISHITTTISEGDYKQNIVASKIRDIPQDVSDIMQSSSELTSLNKWLE